MPTENPPMEKPLLFISHKHSDSKIATKVIVFQCTKNVPSPFQSQVRVNTHNKVDIEKFTVQFLTDPKFFPHYGKAVAPSLTADSPQISQAAEDLYSQLDAVTPSDEPEPTEKWPSLAYVQLAINLDDVQTINDTEKKNRVKVALDIFLENSTVSESDNVAASLFGMPSLRKGMFLKELINNWKERGNSTDEGWIELLIEQLTSASCWRFPKIEWQLLKGADNKWYAPLLNWVKKEPSLNLIFFDVHFIPFTIPEDQKIFEIPVPQD